MPKPFLRGPITARPGLGGGPGTGLGNAYAGLGQLVGASLSGSADVISAKGQYGIANQQGMLLREQVRQTQLDTKRKALEEWLYERAITPTAEDERQRNQWEQLRRSRNNAPFAEIRSGEALNNLLGSIRKTYSVTQQGPPVPIPAAVLPRINYTSGATAMGAGLLKPGVKLPWPDSLQDTAFDQVRANLDELTATAMAEVSKSGQVPGKTVREINKGLDALDSQITTQMHTADVTPTDSIQSLRFPAGIEGIVPGVQTAQCGSVLWGGQQARCRQHCWAYRPDEHPRAAFRPGAFRR